MSAPALVAAAVVAASVLAAPATAATWVDDVRDATRDFRKVAAAEKAGYAEFRDADGIACIEHHHDGAMGIHYVHGKRVADDRVRARRPEALVYEPRDNGTLRLVAVEYIVFKEAWRASHPTGKPTLKGHTFTLVPAGNRYGIPAFYELHLWAWKHNPAGRFADYNPSVDCPAP